MVSWSVLNIKKPFQTLPNTDIQLMTIHEVDEQEDKSRGCLAWSAVKKIDKKL